MGKNTKKGKTYDASSLIMSDSDIAVSDQKFVDKAVKQFFRMFVIRTFERSWSDFQRIYIVLADEFPISEIPYSGTTYSYIRDSSDEAAADFAENAIIEYFNNTSDKKFARRFIEEACSQSDIKKAGDAVALLVSDPSYSEWKKAVKRVKRQDMLLLYLWSDEKCDGIAMRRTIFAVGQRLLTAKDEESALDIAADAKVAALKHTVLRKIERKLGKSFEDAIYDSYCEDSPADSVQKILPEMDPEKLHTACESAASAICELVSRETVIRHRNACSISLCQASTPKIEAFIQFDPQQAVHDGVFLAAICALMGQTVGMSHDYLEEKRKNYRMTEPAIMKKSQQAISKAEAEKNRLEKELKRAKAENEVLRKRAEQAEIRMKQQKNKPDEAQKKAGDEIRRLRKALDRLQEDNGNLNSQNEKLKKEISLLQEAYVDQPAPETDANIDTKARYLFVTDKDIMIRKLRAWFPNSVISGEKHVKTFSGVAMVVFVCAEVSHPEYYRVKKMARAAGVETVHCSHISYSAICDCIKSHGKQYGN